MKPKNLSHPSFRVALSSLLMATAFIAFAREFGPFIMSSIALYVGVSYESDRELNFVAASNLPRLVMNTSVQSIKMGDIVRIVYPDGRVFDFEVTRRCAYANSFPCEYSKATQVSHSEAPTTPSEFRMALERDKASCNGGAGGAYTSSTIPMVRWTTVHDWNEVTQTFTTTGISSISWFTFTFQIVADPSCQ